MAAYDSPFMRSELIGYFRWDTSLTERVSRLVPNLYHACHKRQFELFYAQRELFLRSKYDVAGSREADTHECVWLSLQPWHVTHGHNHHGPITIKLPVGTLTGRRFYIFKRSFANWTHIYFVQRETLSPLWRLCPAKKVDPTTLFHHRSVGRYARRAATQYEVILTEAAPLKDARFIATAHNRCIPRICGGVSNTKALRMIEETVNRERERLLRQFPQCKKLILARE